MPQVSIIMPAYNTEEYIEEAIESVIQQTFTEWELLIIDDGSPDGLAEIVKKYVKGDSRIRLIQQENAGVSVARNRGIQEAIGKYISFLDSDDYYLPSFLDKLLKRAQETRGEIIYCGYITEGRKKNFFIGTPYREGNLLYPILFGEQKIAIVALLIRRDFLNLSQIQFTPNCRMAEDWEFIAKIIAKAQNYYAVQDELYFYRHRLGSATKLKYNPYLEDCVKVNLRLKEFLTENYFKEDRDECIERVSIISGVLFENARKALAAGDYPSILMMLEKYKTDFPLKTSGVKQTILLKIVHSRSEPIWRIYSTMYFFRKSISQKFKKIIKFF